MEQAMGIVKEDTPRCIRPDDPALAFMWDLQPYMATWSREVRDSFIKLLIKHKIPTGGILGIEDYETFISSYRCEEN